MSLSALLKLDGAKFVRSCYRTLLQREPDTSGFSFYMELLGTGTSRNAVINGFLSSAEANLSSFAGLAIASEFLQQTRVSRRKSIFRKVSNIFRRTKVARPNPPVPPAPANDPVEIPAAPRRAVTETLLPLANWQQLNVSAGSTNIWLDITCILQWTSGVVGIVRVELEMASLLQKLHPNLRYVLQWGKGFVEVPKDQLGWLLGSDSPTDAYMEFFGRKAAECTPNSINVSAPLSDALFHPFSAGDSVVSVGWMDNNKEIYYQKVKLSINIYLFYLIYDVILALPETKHYYQSHHRENFRKYIRWIYNNSDFILFGGETARIDAERIRIEQGWPIRPSKALKFGTDVEKPSFDADDERILSELGLKQPFIMTVGSIEPRKNHETLYRAYIMALEAAPKELPILVICGRPNGNTGDLLDTLGRDLRVKGRILQFSPTDEQLAAMYRNCMFTLLPSVYEGWSLTLPESLGAGKFCLASDTPPLREIGEGLVEFIPPFDTRRWAERIVHYATDNGALTRATSKVLSGWQPAKWEDTARELLDFVTASHAAASSAGPERILADPTVATVWMDITLSYLAWTGNVTGVIRAELSFAKFLKKIAPSTRYFAYSDGYYFEVDDGYLLWLFENDDITSSYGLFQRYWSNAESSGAGRRNPISDSGVVNKENPAYIEKFPDNSILFFAGIDFGIYEDNGKPKLFRNQDCENIIDFEKNITRSQLIYDYTPILFPHLHKAETVNGYLPFLEYVSNEFDHLVFGGRTAMADGAIVQNEHHWKSAPSSFVEFGSDIHFSTSELPLSENAQILKKFNISKPFIILVGTYEPRKNHEVIYRAYLTIEKNGLARDDFQIVFVGRDGWKSEDLFHQIRSDERVRDKIVLAHPDDNELDVLYRSCRFTLLPSFYEGWSLTLPESLSYGKMCLAADVAPLRETGGDLVEYIHPMDSVGWAERIAHYLNNPDELASREETIRRLWHARSWHEATVALLENLQHGHRAALARRFAKATDD